MGLKRPAETLQAISESHDITRERVRQIESKVVKRAIKEAAWDDLLTAKLHRLLDGREFPLPLLGVEAVDEWFAGVSESPAALRYILAEFCGDQIGIVRIDGVDYLGFLQQDEWEEALTEAKRILSLSSGLGMTEDQCRAVVTPYNQGDRAGISGSVLEKLRRLCHFGEGVGGQRVLC